MDFEEGLFFRGGEERMVVARRGVNFAELFDVGAKCVGCDCCNVA